MKGETHRMTRWRKQRAEWRRATNSLPKAFCFPIEQRAIKRKVATLKAEADRLTSDLVGAEKKIARLQCAQSDLIAKLARAAAHKVDIRNHIDRLREEIHKEEGGL